MRVGVEFGFGGFKKRLSHYIPQNYLRGYVPPIPPTATETKHPHAYSNTLNKFPFPPRSAPFSSISLPLAPLFLPFLRFDSSHSGASTTFSIGTPCPSSCVLSPVLVRSIPARVCTRILASNPCGTCAASSSLEGSSWAMGGSSFKITERCWNGVDTVDMLIGKIVARVCLSIRRG